MTRLTDAIAWSGRDVTFSLFVAFPSRTTQLVPAPAQIPAAQLIKHYDLEDVDHHLRGRSCCEYDLIYDEVPPDLESIVVSWISTALSAGADFAWFGFEGSFDFEHILTSDVANQLFAVGIPEGIQLAIDDQYREGPEWAALVGSMRDRLGL